MIKRPSNTKLTIQTSDSKFLSSSSCKKCYLLLLVCFSLIPYFFLQLTIPHKTCVFFNTFRFSNFVYHYNKVIMPYLQSFTVGLQSSFEHKSSLGKDLCEHYAIMRLISSLKSRPDITQFLFVSLVFCYLTSFSILLISFFFNLLSIYIKVSSVSLQRYILVVLFKIN